MPEHPELRSADADIDARTAIWKAIRLAAEQLLSRCTVLMFIEGVQAARPIIGRPIPNVRTWQLVEALSLLTLLLRASAVRSDSVTLFVKCGPLDVIEDGHVRYVWSQHSVGGHYSELNGRPDLIVTSTNALPSSENILRVVEVKCVQQIGAQLVRAEFAKAHDLKVRTYFVWSFFTPAPRVVAGAKGLGIDLHELGFDTASRAALVADPAALLSKVAHTMEQSRREDRFARRLSAANEEVQRKLLGPAQ